MPVININLDDLRTLLKRKVSDDMLTEVLELNKIKVEEFGKELKLEVTADRPDLFSSEGIARQLNAWLGHSVPAVYSKSKPKVEEMKTEKLSLRPHISCAVVRGLKMSDRVIKSIMQLQEALDFTIGMDRKKVAIGIHDIKDAEPPFTYKEVIPETVWFVPLGTDKKMNLKDVLFKHPKGVKYKHLVEGNSRYPLIVDKNENVLSFPPIINGELTKVTSDTKDFFIEMTGSNKQAIDNCMRVLLSAMADRGGIIEDVKINGRPSVDIAQQKIMVKTEDIKRTLGLNIKDSEIVGLLKRMNYKATKAKNNLNISVPPYRVDILHSIDIIEDIAIAYGYNNFIPEVPKLPVFGSSDPMQDLSNTVRSLMVGLGFQEIMNYTLASRHKQLKNMELEDSDVVEISNPVSDEYGICRTWLLPGMIEVLSKNKHRSFPQMVFEIGDCIRLNPKTESGAENKKKVCCAISHSNACFSEIVSIINAFMESFGIVFSVENSSHPSFIEGRCGKVVAGNGVLCVFGEISPKVLNNWGLEKPVVSMEIDISLLGNSIIPGFK
jgi:phenylalanyl-tRNA synthetase beta chain